MFVIRLIGITAAEKLISILKAMLILGAIPSDKIVFYEYFRQAISSGKYTDSGVFSLLERDFTDKSVKSSNYWLIGFVVELFLTGFAMLISFCALYYSKWPYIDYLVFVILLIPIVRLRNLVEVDLVIRKKRNWFLVLNICASILSLTLFLVFKGTSLFLAIYLSSLAMYFCHAVYSIMNFQLVFSYFLKFPVYSWKNLKLYLKRSGPLILLSLSFGVSVIVERMFFSSLGTQFANYFAACILLLGLSTPILNILNRFQRQSINALILSQRHKKYREILVVYIISTIPILVGIHIALDLYIKFNEYFMKIDFLDVLVIGNQSIMNMVFVHSFITIGASFSLVKTLNGICALISAHWINIVFLWLASQQNIQAQMTLWFLTKVTIVFILILSFLFLRESYDGRA